ncbi:MAG TPA: hypothetical protein VGL55_00870 [Steroidobacteraceae bacterium]|jgi:hypothetical protein
MDWDFARADWARFRDEVRSNWTMLSACRLDLIAGERARLASNLEEVYGITGEQAERQIRTFELRNTQLRPVSLR